VSQGPVAGVLGLGPTCSSEEGLCPSVLGEEVLLATGSFFPLVFLFFSAALSCVTAGPGVTYIARAACSPPFWPSKRAACRSASRAGAWGLELLLQPPPRCTAATRPAFSCLLKLALTLYHPEKTKISDLL